MLTTVKTFDGHNINDGVNYETSLTGVHTPPASSPLFIQITNADPQYSGAYTLESKTITLDIYIRDYGTRYALISQLKTWLKPGISGDLVATFNDDMKDYMLTCEVQSLVQDRSFSNHFTAILLAASSTWKWVTPETDEWNVTSSGSVAVTVSGKDETRLIAEITATGTPVAGYLYQRIYQLVNVPKYDFGYRPWCITLDTQTLISAGKMQADCNDLRVFVRDQEVRRWIAGANTPSTNIWFNLWIGPGYSLDLLTAIGTGTITELAFKVSATNQASIKAMPTSGIVYHGNEWFEYSAKDMTKCKLTVRKRGVYGTTVESHSTSSVFKFIQSPIVVVYGNTEVGDPADDDEDYDEEKPVFNLEDSDNTTWVYDATTIFYDPDHPYRTGAWSPAVTRVGNVSNTYNVKENADSGDPAMGMLMSTWEKGTTWTKETATLSWTMKCAGGINKVSTTGRKYRLTATWPTTAALQWSPNGISWGAVWSETSPSVGSWTAFTQSNKSIYLHYPIVRFVLSGGISNLSEAYAMLEVLTCTVEFYTANMPVGTLLSEASNYPMDLSLENQSTGDLINLLFPLQLNKAFKVDGENYEVTYDETNAHGALTLDDESRAEWIRLNPGENILNITGTSGSDLGTLDINLSWYPRRV